MHSIAFFDTRPYDRESFDRHRGDYEIRYFEVKLGRDTVSLARGCDAVCAFVNDQIDKTVIDALAEMEVQVIALRCAGYSNVDLEAARGRMPVLRVPAYSPHAVAEHAMALLLALNRHLPRAYNRTRDFNFNIAGLEGRDLHGKAVGVVGTGRIGQAFIQICRGFGMDVAAHDPYPVKDADWEYLPLDQLLERSDVVSLHCPLTQDSHHLLSRDAFSKMKKGAFLINTSRGALIDSAALLDALGSDRLAGAGLDVYEEEGEYFFEDCSDVARRDEVLSLLVSHPKVLLTSHQAFLTQEALDAIAATTMANLDDFFSGKACKNEVKA